MKKIIFFAIAIFVLGMVPKPAEALFSNPCDDCKFFLKYCCPGKCPVVDLQHSVWEAVRGKQHRNRLKALGAFRDAWHAKLKAIGIAGPRISSGEVCEPARALISYPTHGTEYGTPTPDRWLHSIADPKAAAIVDCSDTDRVRKLRLLRSSSIADASNALPNIATAMEYASQKAGAAIRGAETATDLRDLTLRLADLIAVRNLTHSIINTTLGVRMQLQTSLATPRLALVELKGYCE